MASCQLSFGTHRRASAWASAPRKPQCSWAFRVSQRLHVGAKDIANTTDFRVAADFVDASLLLVKAIFQCLNCDIESDLVPELKTVDYCLHGGVDADMDSFDLMVFSSFSLRRSGEAHDPECWRNDSRCSCPFAESDPNRGGTLGCDLVKGESRKQANNCFRASLGYCGVRMVFRHVGVWERVDSTSMPIQLTLAVETNEIFPRKADSPRCRAA